MCGRQWLVGFLVATLILMEEVRVEHFLFGVGLVIIVSLWSWYQGRCERGNIC